MAVTITQGSDEFLIVVLDDLLDNVNDLASSSPFYTVYRDDIHGQVMINNLTAQANGMKLYCLVDTTSGSGLTTPTVPVNGWWAADTYQLYVKFTVAPEVPRIGPFTFQVTDSR